MEKCQYKVYRANGIGDCSNHGLSSYVNDALLFFIVQ